MLDVIYQYGVTFAILFIVAALILVFGALVAGSVYAFIWIHVEAYIWIKNKITGVYNGIISANA